MALPPALLEILVCPKTKQRLVYFPRGEDDQSPQKAFLIAPAARLRYRIDDGVPVLLIEEAEELTPAEADRLQQRAKQLGLVP